jgi:23S rRNA pseudouridine1911/1915/1917 synthase
MEPEAIKICVPEENHLERIDRFLSQSLEIDLSRNYIQKLIKEENILVNGKPIKQNYRVKADDSILISIPEPEELSLAPEDIPIQIIFEDESIALINKSPGMVVHPGPGNWNRTLVNALLFHLRDLSSIGGISRPGIIHRLDKDTSGLMIIAKNDHAHRFLTQKFSRREIKKRYAAMIVGKPRKPHDIINRPIGRHPRYRHKMTIREDGREAITEYFLKDIWNSRSGLFSLMDIVPHTGRTHQIRVHLSSIGNPIVGDPVYSKRSHKYRVPHLLLAAVSIEFDHPDSKERLRFEIPLPENIKNFIKRLKDNP